MTNSNVFARNGLASSSITSKKSIITLSRPFFEGYSEEIAQNIFHVQNDFLKIKKERDDIQEKINLIEKQKAEEVLQGSDLFWYYFILWGPVLGTVAFTWHDFKWYSIAFFGFVVFCFSLGWATGFAKKIFVKELAGLEGDYNQKSTEYVNIVQDNLVPQIHKLKLASYKDIREKTYAFALEDSLLKQLLEILEIDDQIETVNFNDIKTKEAVTLYKSLLVGKDEVNEEEGAMDSMELVID